MVVTRRPCVLLSARSGDAVPWSTWSSELESPTNHVIVMFGATGDLAKRKLLPGLYHLAAAGLMPEDYRIIGSAPGGGLSDEAFRDHAEGAIREFGRRELSDDVWPAFSSRLSFVDADSEKWSDLVTAVDAATDDIEGEVHRLHHLAVPPVAFTSMVEMLGHSGLGKDARVIVEKPFGTDLAAAQELNATLHSVFDESQIFRIDHYLGKESVENVLAFRFANGMFEHLWNRNDIAYVQIDVTEAISIEGRGAFYEQTGAFRDMVVTHLMQVLSFVAMEPPTSLTTKPVRDEKSKVFAALEPLDPSRVVRGQYEGYLDEPGVAPDSDTETMVALQAQVDNWRWAGVPFFLRTGKSLAEHRQVVVLGFREPPMRMFGFDEDGNIDPNELVIDFGDPGSISIGFRAKEPGPDMVLGPARLTFAYDRSFQSDNQLSGYERLIYNAMLGDQTFFTRSDGIERLWEAAVPLLADPPPVRPYPPGSWGPAAIDDLVRPFRWHLGQD